MRISHALILALSLATFAHAQPPAPQSAPEIDRITVVHVACDRGCPTYRLELSPDGVVRYEGMGFVKVFGRRSWVIPEQQAAKLFRDAADTELVPTPQNSAHLLTAKGECGINLDSPVNIALHTPESSGFPAEACFSPKVKALTVAVEESTGVAIYASGEDTEAQRAIRAVLDSQVEAWNKGDLDGYMRGYWKSPELTFFGGATETSGWRQTLERYRKSYKSEGKQMGKLSFDNVRIEMLSPDAAFVRGQWKLEMPNGQKPHGVYTLIVRKLPDGWRIIHDHSSGN
jgi:beta-aspartyl-peptidase (threonine type)